MNESNELYAIETGNRFNQVLIFTDKEEAKKWMKKATVLNEEQIEKEIKTLHKNWQGHFDFFPGNIE